MSRPKIVLDTVVIFKALVLKDSAAKYVLGLYNEHLAGDIQLVIPKCVQAEFYGMLRSGRSEVKVNDEYVPRLLTHDEIVQYLSLFEGLFDFDFINQLRDLDWRQGKDENGNLYYKQTYNQIVKQEYGWPDLGQ
ncbi:MAG: hypothetical protein JWN30_467, partial [Bacilli bacterium]|nr:hypothetical protein [Bacilli bacterium]